MLPLKKNKLISKGDYISSEEALQDDHLEIQFRCEIIDEVIKDKVMSLDMALKAYAISIEQYVGYILMKGKTQKINVTQSMFVSLMRVTLSIMNISSQDLQPKANRIVEDMRLLAKIK